MGPMGPMGKGLIGLIGLIGPYPPTSLKEKGVVTPHNPQFLIFNL